MTEPEKPDDGWRIFPTVWESETPPDNAERSADGRWATLYADDGRTVEKVWWKPTDPHAKLTR